MNDSFFGVSALSILRLFIEHVELCLMAMGIAIVTAFPAGIILRRFHLLSEMVVLIFGTLYTIPSLAMLAMLIPFSGLGKGSAVFALVIYAQFILIRHVILGLKSIDPVLLEAGRGMGLTALQLFRLLEIPQALPIWLSGLRIATLSTIGIATMAAWINAGGLGTLIFEGLSQNNTSRIVMGAILISSLSLWLDQILRQFESEAYRASQGDPESIFQQ